MTIFSFLILFQFAYCNNNPSRNVLIEIENNPILKNFAVEINHFFSSPMDISQTNVFINLIKELMQTNIKKSLIIETLFVLTDKTVNNIQLLNHAIKLNFKIKELLENLIQWSSDPQVLGFFLGKFSLSFPQNYSQNVLHFYKHYDITQLEKMFQEDELELILEKTSAPLYGDYPYISAVIVDPELNIKRKKFNPSFKIDMNEDVLVMSFKRSLWIRTYAFRNFNKSSISDLIKYTFLKSYENLSHANILQSVPVIFRINAVVNQVLKKNFDMYKDLIGDSIDDAEFISQFITTIPNMEGIVRLSQFFHFQIDSFAIIKSFLDGYDILLKLTYNENGDPRLIFFKTKDELKKLLSNVAQFDFAETFASTIQNVLNSKIMNETNIAEIINKFYSRSSGKQQEEIWRKKVLNSKSLQEVFYKIYDELNNPSVKNNFAQATYISIWIR